MANISETYGKMMIVADTPECIDNIMNIFAINECDDYSTYIIDKNAPIHQFPDGSCMFISEFSGTGRWSYNNNVMSFGEWYDGYDLANQLEPFNWQIKFDYSDYEPGNGVLYDETDMLEHTANTPFCDTKYRMLNDNVYYPSIKNILNKGFEDGSLCSYVETHICTDERSEAEEELYDLYGMDLLDYFEGDQKAMHTVVSQILDELYC